jgi:arylsulfatase A-like enzyme/ankyrin repeat protein
LLALSACTSESPPTQPALRANVILISIDTLRADRLGCYGYDRTTSPSIDRFAARGVRFSRAIAESSWTLPSHMTMMTGLHPSAHGVTSKAKRLSPEIPLLAQVLRGAGYRTYAFTGGGLVGRTWGFDRGFERYEDGMARTFENVLAMARLQIESFAPDERYFLFLHAYDVHAPYDTPDPYASLFRTRPPEDAVDVTLTNQEQNKLRLSAGQIRFLSDQYDAGIRIADDRMGAFFAWLEERGALANTIVLVVSDHGEELGEHGALGHGMKLYIESLHVPMIIVAPGALPGVVDDTVGLADLAPTVLDLLGLDRPFAQGRSLAAFLRSRPPARQDDTVFSELEEPRLRSALQGRFHLIAGSDGAAPALFFDWLADPKESRPLSFNADATRLQHALAQHVASLSPVRAAQQSEIPAAVAERLRALGYGDAPGAAPPSTMSGVADAAGGDVSALERLLRDGADANAVDARGVSALARAAESGNLEAAKLLLAHGAMVNVSGRTPLIAAAASGHRSMVELLLDHGAQVNAGEWNGATALQHAAENGHTPVLELLLDRGADRDAADQDGVTALIAAAAGGRDDAVRLLAEGGADVNKATRTHLTALIAAARDCDPASVAALLAHGADRTASSADGSTPLLVAAAANRPATVEVLLDAGTDPNLRGGDGSTALLAAAYERANDAAQVLLDRGADVTARDEEGSTALHLAADDANELLVAALLAHGAVPTARDEDGETPLSLAEGSPRIEEMLRAAMKTAPGRGAEPR